uniref:Uncharacterized protein n=1 Tax=Zea mays TaxID=4577 RepID=A0A804PIF4_MAIZE
MSSTTSSTWFSFRDASFNSKRTRWHGPWMNESGEEDVERAVLGGRAHGARLASRRLAPAAQAQVPARQQQHARLRVAARPARPRPPAGRLVGSLFLLHQVEAARLRVLDVALASAWRLRLREAVERGA